jgi:two-component system chemotaxis response regulator CheY
MAVLIVDDSTTMRRIVKRCLDGMGHEVLEAADGLQALKIIAEKHDRIQLIILDWNVPGMTGLQVLQAVRSDPDSEAIPVMMLTSQADQTFVLEALRAGVQNYLTKPFDPKILTTKIQESLQLSGKAQ